MSIDSRFSKTRFEEAERSDPGARRLADDLQEEVLKLLQDGVLKTMQEIVELLNQNGHRLTPYERQLGCIAFRDDRGVDETYACDLRLAVDVVVSAGYRDTKNWFEDIADMGDEGGVLGSDDQRKL